MGKKLSAGELARLDQQFAELKGHGHLTTSFDSNGKLQVQLTEQGKELAQDALQEWEEFTPRELLIIQLALHKLLGYEDELDLTDQGEELAKDLLEDLVAALELRRLSDL